MRAPMKRTFTLCMLLALPAAAQAPTGPALRGVVFVHEWRFDSPVDFQVAGERQSATSGDFLGIAVHPALFRARGAMRPTIWVNDIAAIDRGGPFGDADNPFVVVQIPEVDLSTARFWVGPREPAERVSAERVRTLRDEAERRGRLTAPLGPAAVSALRAVFSTAPPRDPGALFESLRAFCRGTDFRTLRATPFGG